MSSTAKTLLVICGAVLALCVGLCGVGAVASLIGGPASTANESASGASSTSRPSTSSSTTSSTTSASSSTTPEHSRSSGKSPTTKAASTATASSPPSPSSKATTGKRPSAVPAGALAVPVLSVYDGDTMRVRVKGTSERVRIIGLDAPELNPKECFGQESASKMQSLAQSRTVWIAADSTQDDRDRYGRLLRHVYDSSGTSLAETMIRGGFATEYTYARAYAGQAAHRRAEATAKSNGRGIWSSRCAQPEPVQAAPAPKPSSAAPSPKPSPAAPAPAAPTPTQQQSCTIKGNIASDGEKIYHLPGQRYYGVTKISPSKGERMFCSEQEALNAGWRRAKV